MSDTPRTDKEAQNYFKFYGGEHIHISWARQLERELNDLRSQAVRLERDAYLGDDDEKRHLRAEVKRLTADLNDANKLYERERAERQKEIGMQEYRGNTVSYIYDKERAYGAHFGRMSAETADLRTQLAAAQADKERLDWLEELFSTTDDNNPTWQQFSLAVAIVGYRAAIDAARQEGVAERQSPHCA